MIIGLSIFIVILPAPDEPLGIEIVHSSTSYPVCLQFLLDFYQPFNSNPVNPERFIYTVPVIGIQKPAETYDSFAQVSSEVMWRYEQSGFGKPGEANTFWAMSMAACDELDALRARVKELEAKSV